MSARQRLDILSEWVRTQKDRLGYTYDRIAQKSGGLINAATANNVVLKRYKSVDDDTIAGLARAFDVTVDYVRGLVYGARPEDTPGSEPRELSLPPELWKELDRDAKACHRTWQGHLHAILDSYFYDSDVNVDVSRLTQARNKKPHAEIADPPNDKNDIIPFAKTAKLGKAKTKAKAKAWSGEN